MDNTVITHFLLQMHNKKMFDLENKGQSDGARRTQRRYSTAISKIYKRHYICLRQLLQISEILSFQVFDLESLGQSR